MKSIFEAFFQDMRYGLRILRRSPGFAAVAVLSLAIGIGANTSLFSVFYAVMIRPLPVEAPERRVLVRKHVGGPDYNLFSVPAWAALQKEQRTLEGLAACGEMWPQLVRLSSGEPLERIVARTVSRNYFSVLGVAAHRGRLFSEKEEEPAAVISDRFWSAQFGRRPDAIGSALIFDGVALTVVGVTPPDFFGDTVGQWADVYVPLDQYRQIVSPRIMENERNHWLALLGRLRPGGSRQNAEAELQVIFRQLPEYARAAAQQREPAVRVEPGRSGQRTLQDRYDKPLLVLMMLAGLLLLIACGNVANLLLARASSRQREIGIRIAVGAAGRRLVGQLTAESLLLSLSGGVLAIWLAVLAGPALVALASDPARPLLVDCRVHWPVFWFTVLVSFGTTLLFGMIPALQVFRLDLTTALKATGNEPGRGLGRNRAGRVLVVLQVALSVVLLLGAGLLLRTLGNLQGLDPGFHPQNVILGRLTFALTPEGMERLKSLAAPVCERIQALPGVEAVGLSTYGGLARGHQNEPVSLPDRPGEKDRSFRLNHISDGYYEAYGIDLLRGRAFQATDTAASAPVVGLNQSAARLLFGGENPIGRRLCLGEKYDPARAREVVGLVRDAKYTDLREEIPPQLYIPLSQSSSPGIILAVRSKTSPAAILGPIRQAISSLGGKTGLIETMTLQENIDATLVQERMMARLSMMLGMLSLVLAVVGIYGIMSYSTARRTREIGIRMAVGATPWKVRRMVLGEAAAMVLAGLVAGLPVALAAGRYLESLLYGLPSGDPLTVLAVMMLLLLAGLTAAFLPARQASRIHPVTALRFE